MVLHVIAVDVFVLDYFEISLLLLLPVKRTVLDVSFVSELIVFTYTQH